MSASPLAEYGIETRLASPDELRAVLLAVKCGLADDSTKKLLGHIAALAEERDQLRRELADARGGAQ